MQVFVFNQTRVWILDSISKIGDFLEGHRKAKLLAKPPACRGENLLTRTWMAATGIRPLTREVVLVCSSLLQQELPIRVGDQNGKGPMQLSGAMRVDLAVRTDRFILSIDQDNGLKLVTDKIFTRHWLCSHL
jgi:hypothetical protein